MSHPDPKWTYDDLEPPTTYKTDTSITTHIPVELFNEIVALLAEKNIAREKAGMNKLTVPSLTATLLEEWRDLMNVPQ